MKKINLNPSQITNLAQEIGSFFLNSSNTEKVIKEALSIKKISRIYFKIGVLTIEEYKNESMKLSTNLNKQRFIARRVISIAKTKEEMIEIYRCFVRILILSGGGDEIPENLLAIRKMAEIMFK